MVLCDVMYLDHGYEIFNSNSNLGEKKTAELEWVKKSWLFRTSVYIERWKFCSRPGSIFAWSQCACVKTLHFVHELHSLPASEGRKLFLWCDSVWDECHLLHLFMFTNWIEWFLEYYANYRNKRFYSVRIFHFL